MNIYFISGALALAAIIFSLGAFGTRWAQMQRMPFPNDRTIPKDSPLHGVLYAFTLGMAPWAKESTRTHWVSYLRGIGFHVGIFAGLAALLASPWFDQIDLNVRAFIAIVTGLGALLGAAGGIMRLVEQTLREVSTPDDHLSLWLVTIFLAAITGAAIWTSLLPAMWIVAAALLVYAPLGKIRHCLYFYFGRLFYGLHIGRRGVVRGLEASHGR